MLKATSRASVIGIFYQALRLLFGLKAFIFFLYDYERDLLIGKETGDGDSDKNPAKLLVPYYESKSLLVRALRKASLLSTFKAQPNGTPVLMDEQIKRHLKKEGFFCFPLITNRSKVGVLVIGSDNIEAAGISLQEKQISLLVDQVAIALHTGTLRKIQRRQLQSERIEASSEMARRIVHEANNPLSIIKNYLSVMMRKLEKENKDSEELRIISEEVERVARLLDELTELSTPQQIEREYTDVKAIISDLVTLSRETLLSHTYVQLRLDKTMPKIMAGKDRLKQVILNLIKNPTRCPPGVYQVVLPGHTLQRAQFSARACPLREVLRF